MKRIFFLICGLAFAITSPAFAAPNTGRTLESGDLDHGAANAVAGKPQNLKNALVLLRIEAVGMQQDDGGTLTAEHRDYLRTKLDRLTGKRLGTLRDL